MRITYCDICQSLIKEGATKFILGINEMTETGDNSKEKIEDFAEFVRRYRDGIESVQIYEICEDCKKILEYLFKMRMKERRKILEDIEKIYERKPKGMK